MKKTNIATINFTENDFYVREKSGMPGLKIHVTAGNEEKEYYLYPFRAYRFQVCETIDGQNDLGSCEVIGLANVLTAIPEATGDWGRASNLQWGGYSVVAELYSGLIFKALNQFTMTPHFPGNAIVNGYDRGIIEKFAILCVAWAAINTNREDILNEIMTSEYDWYITDSMKELINTMKK